VLFLRYRRIPFISAYEPSVELKSHGVLYVVTLLVLCFVLAAIERFALETIVRYAAFVGVEVGFAAALAAFDRAGRHGLVVLDVDEEQPLLPTLRLGLLG